MLDAPTDVQDLLASRPEKAIVANLFTFTLLSGPVLTFTDRRRDRKVGGVTFLAGPPRLVRGTISTVRGMSVSTQKVTIQEANGEFIGMLARGFFNRAVYSMQRQFAVDPAALAWTSPFTRFAGRVNSVDSITSSSAELTIKSMLDDLDQDYPRGVVQTDCNRVLFDVGCGLDAAAFRVTGTASAGCTVNKLLSGLSNPDVYFTQGVVTFTSGANSGLSWMVKSYVGGVVVPSYPFLVAPAAGDTFSITPGCDKTLATCTSKYSYNPSAGVAPFFRGLPFVPDPTVTY
jgi:uncharacterized phage protein (TIGR02218 family)